MGLHALENGTSIGSAQTGVDGGQMVYGMAGMRKVYVSGFQSQLAVKYKLYQLL
jgi:hypothetical protein